MTTQSLHTPCPDAPSSVSDEDRDATQNDLPYHRVALTHARPRWWRPLLTVVFSGVAYAVLVFATGILTMIVIYFVPYLEPAMTVWAETDTFDLDTPLGLVLGCGMLALMIPAVAIGLRLAEKQSLGRLSSVAGHLRGALLVPMLGLAALVFTPYVAIDALVQWHQGSLDISITNRALLMITLALLVVPFQAAAEEYVFRGLPQQVLGAWLKSPWWGILIPIPFFVLGHTYDLYGQVNIGVFALAMGILVWRTGGLEAAIALHVVNNLVVLIGDVIGFSHATTHEVSVAAFWFSNGIIIAFTALAITYHHRVTHRGRGSEVTPCV